MYKCTVPLHQVGHFMHASESDIIVFVTLKDVIVFYCTLQCLYVMECWTQGMRDVKHMPACVISVLIV